MNQSSTGCEYPKIHLVWSFTSNEHTVHVSNATLTVTRNPNFMITWLSACQYQTAKHCCFFSIPERFISIISHYTQGSTVLMNKFNVWSYLFKVSTVALIYRTASFSSNNCFYVNPADISLKLYFLPFTSEPSNICWNSHQGS